MAAEHGYLAAMPRDGRLTLMKMLDGSTIWERDLRGEPVDSVWMRSDCVVTADASLQRVNVFGRGDGRLIGQVLFSQPDVKDKLVQLVWTGDMLCGPDSTAGADAVIAVNMVDGASAWRVEVNKPLVQLFEVQEGFVGAGLLGGDVWIINASTGEVVLQQQVASVAPVTDGLFVDGTLVVQTESTQSQRTYVDLTAFDVATGEEIWEREDIVPFLGSPPPLRAVNGAVPALVASRGSNVRSGGIAERTRGIALAMIDLDTGLNSGPVIDLPSMNSGTQMKGDMRIAPSTLIVGTTKNIQAFKIGPVDPEIEEDFQ
jgi:outer membrane protein assembly factor BamB